MAKEKQIAQAIAAMSGAVAVVLFGIIGVGIIFLFIGSLLESHYGVGAAICNTYGQFSANCAGNEGLFTVGQILHAIGLIAIAAGIVIDIVAVFSIWSRVKAKSLKSSSTGHSTTTPSSESEP